MFRASAQNTAPRITGRKEQIWKLPLPPFQKKAQKKGRHTENLILYILTDLMYIFSVFFLRVFCRIFMEQNQWQQCWKALLQQAPLTMNNFFRRICLLVVVTHKIFYDILASFIDVSYSFFTIVPWMVKAVCLNVCLTVCLLGLNILCILDVFTNSHISPWHAFPSRRSCTRTLPK